MRLKELREKSVMTQQELADKLNVHRSAVANYERNNNYPNVSIILMIADIFQVSTDYLLERKNNVYEIGNLTVSQRELLEKIKNLNDTQVKQISGYIDAVEQDWKNMGLTENFLKRNNKK